jgi:hypothetical protein
LFLVWLKGGLGVLQIENHRQFIERKQLPVSLNSDGVALTI